MKKIRIIDVVIILCVILALVVGFFTYKHFRQTASKQVESTSKIAFQVFLRGVTITGRENPIKTGEDTFISIRNVPYTNLKVVDTKIDTKKVVMPSSKSKEPFVLVEDYSQAFMYDIIVTVIDTAKITKDGAVVGGNKIKIGLPITLEGKDYKFNGTVSDLLILPPNFKLPSEQAKPVSGQKPGAPVAPQTPQGGPQPPQGPGPQGQQGPAPQGPQPSQSNQLRIK